MKWRIMLNGFAPVANGVRIMPQKLGKSLEQRLELIPASVLSRADKRKIAKFHNDLDGIGRRQPGTQETYIDGPNFRKVLKKHLPPTFVDRLIVNIRSRPGGDKLIRLQSDGEPVGLSEMLSDPSTSTDPVEAFKSMGLHNASSVQAFNKAIKRHYSDVPDDAFRPDFGARIRETTESIGGSVAADIEPASLTFGQRFDQCIQTFMAAAWWVIGIIALIGFLYVLIFTGQVGVAIGVAILWGFIAAILVPLLLLIGCLVAALFG